ncbi:MAG: flagellin, partial [Planctomycetota bacterium]
YSGGAVSSDTTLEVLGNNGSQVIQLDSGSTVANIRDAINAASDATGVTAAIGDGLTLSTDAQAGTYTLSTNAIKNDLDVAGTGGGNITFTDARGTATEGADATLGGTLSITLTDGGNGNGASAVSAITTDASGNINIDIDLADDGGGTSLATFADISAAIAGNATAASLVSVTDNASAGVINFAGSTDLTGGVDGESVTFSDRRSSATEGAFDTLGGTLSIDLNSAGATAATAATDADGNVTVTVDIAAGATLQDVVNAIAADQTAGGAAEFVLSDVTDIGTGTTLVTDTGGAQLFTDGHDGTNNDVSFTDVRADPSAGTVRVDFNNAGADQTLSVNVVSAGDDHDITVTLATDADGNITSTAEDVAALLNADSSVNVLVSASSEGDGSELVADSGGLANGVLDTGDGALVLTSSGFGTDEFVEVNVLSGSFDTTLDDSTTVASRDTGADIGVQINGVTAQTSGLSASIKTSSLDATITFNEGSNTADETASITISGGGATFQIGQEVSSTGQLGIGIEAVNTARLGGVSGKLHELGSGGGKSLLDVGSGQSGADLVNIVDQALERVSTLRGRLGAIQKNVIETNVSALGVALENISEARSQIVDTDFAEETAALTRGQILSQAGISVLSIANQQPQQVLSLLG